MKQSTAYSVIAFAIITLIITIIISLYRDAENRDILVKDFYFQN